VVSLILLICEQRVYSTFSNVFFIIAVNAFTSMIKSDLMLCYVMLRCDIGLAYVT